METKKNNKANLERKKSTFFLMGITITLAFALISFEWSSKERDNHSQVSLTGGKYDIEITPLTIEKKTEPPRVISPEVFEVIDNNTALPHAQIIFDDPRGVGQSIPEYVLVIPADTAATPEEFRIVEEMPQFRGGDISRFSQWVNERIRYPQLAQENGIQGMVVVDFAVSSDGTVTDIRIVRSVEKSIDEEVLRVVSGSPKWTPGKQRGVPVKVRFTIPIHFRLK